MSSPSRLLPLLKHIRDVLCALEEQVISLSPLQHEQLLHLRLDVDRAIEDAKQAS